MLSSHRSPQWYEESGRETVLSHSALSESDRVREKEKGTHITSLLQILISCAPSHLLSFILSASTHIHTYTDARAKTHTFACSLCLATCCEDLCSNQSFALGGEGNLFFLLYLLYDSLNCLQILRLLKRNEGENKRIVLTVLSLCYL